MDTSYSPISATELAGCLDTDVSNISNFTQTGAVTSFDDDTYMGISFDLLQETSYMDAGSYEFSTARSTLVTADNTAPVLTAPTTRNLGTDTGKATASLDVTSLGSASDNRDSTVAIIYKIGSTTLTGAHDFPLGDTTVTMDASDEAGNDATQVSFIVRVSDDENPVLTAPTNQTATAASGDNSVSVDVTNLGSISDNVDDDLAITYQVGSTVLSGAHDFPIGETTVTLDATDAAGNDATQVSFTVTVADGTAPVLTAPPQQTATAAAGASTVSLDVTALGSVSDNYDTSVAVTYRVGSTVLTGAYDFPIGETTVTMDASDAAGNDATQVSFTVKVSDGTAPVLTPPSNQSATAASGEDTASLDVTGLGSVSDDVDTEVEITYQVGDTVLSGTYDFPIGVTTVTMDASDTAGNAATQVSFTVTVDDGTAPVLTPPEDQSATTASGESTVSLDVTALGSVSDNVGGSLSITYRVGSTVLTGAYDFPIGETTVTMDASDATGNDATQVSFTVTVLDGTPPPPPTISDVTINSDKTVTVSGTAQSGATVTVTFPDGTSVETTASDSSQSSTADSARSYAVTIGTYSATSASAQPSGSVTAVASTSGGGASATATVTVDTTSPDVVLSGGPSDGIGAQESFAITVTFSEGVTGFVTSDIVTQNASVLSVSGSGTDYIAQLRASGSGAITVQIPAGAAEDAAGNATTASNILRFDDRTIVETQEQIAGFLYTRANQLIANQPELIGFLSHSDAGSGVMQAHVTRGAGDFNLTSRSGLPIWFRLQGSWSEEDQSETRYAFGAVGGHLNVSDRFLLGAMLQFDHLNQDEGARRIEGTGWLAGPYAVAQLSDQALYLEARVLYGQSANTISPFGTYEDDFDTTRMLAQLRLAGEVEHGETTFTPYVDAAYANEEQEAYIDSLGNTIGAQKIHLRQATFGVGFARPFATGGDAMAELTGGLAGVWSATSGTAVAETVIPAYTGWRAEVKLGVRYQWASGSRFAISARYDGLGSEGYKDFGLTIDYSLRF